MPLESSVLMISTGEFQILFEPCRARKQLYDENTPLSAMQGFDFLRGGFVEQRLEGALSLVNDFSMKPLMIRVKGVAHTVNRWLQVYVSSRTSSYIIICGFADRSLACN